MAGSTLRWLFGARAIAARVQAIEDDGTGAEATARPVVASTEGLPSIGMAPPAGMPTLLQALALTTRPPEAGGGNAGDSGGMHGVPSYLAPPPASAHASNATAYMNAMQQGRAQPQQHAVLPAFAAAHEQAAARSGRSGVSISDVSNTLQPRGPAAAEQQASQRRNVHFMQWQVRLRPPLS